MKHPSTFSLLTSYPEDRHFQTLLAALLVMWLVTGGIFPYLSLPALRLPLVATIAPSVQIIAAVELPKPPIQLEELSKPRVPVARVEPVPNTVLDQNIKPSKLEPLVEKPQPAQIKSLKSTKPQSQSSPQKLSVTTEDEMIEAEITDDLAVTRAARNQARESASKSGLMMMRSQLQQLQQTAASSASVPIGAKRASQSDTGGQVVYQSDALAQQQVAVRGVASTGSAIARTATQVGYAAPSSNQGQLGQMGGKKSSNSGNSQQSGVRDEASIRQVFEQNKSSIFALYHRALRQQPGLQGKLVFKISIAADGQMIACELISSQLADAELTKKLLTKIRMLNFGSKNVAPLTMTYALDFVPS